ncbi:MAG TPA: aquaporin [Casimicrobiaceae bacterium]|nr:aquaporin [Casimicrobiaceae bacterium]
MATMPKAEKQQLAEAPAATAAPAVPQARRTVAALHAVVPCIAGEFLGTFLLVFFGVGVVNAAVVTGAQVGLWQVAVVWAIGVSLAIYCSASLSGAHLNPAITAVAVAYDDFPPARALVYVVAQLCGAMVASLLLYGLFGEAILEFERRHGLLRGGPGSELSAMVFGEYFPNPAVFGTAEDAWRIVGLPGAFLAEMTGTALLALLVSAVTHTRNIARPAAGTEALLIGVGVGAIISVVAPLTQAGLNPARDFGPRLIAWFLGWGEIAIPGPRGGWFTVYILAPVIGALLGGGAYRILARRLLPAARGGKDGEAPGRSPRADP